jgi:hypothetical protein
MAMIFAPFRNCSTQRSRSEYCSDPLCARCVRRSQQRGRRGSRTLKAYRSSAFGPVASPIGLPIRWESGRLDLNHARPFTWCPIRLRSDRPKRRTVALRASVGSTEAAKDVVARFGGVRPTRASVDSTAPILTWGEGGDEPSNPRFVTCLRRATRREEMLGGQG